MSQPVTPIRLSADNPGPSVMDDLPGPLQHKISLTTESRYARLLVLGRKAAANRPAIMGLLAYADRLRVIWHAARADDPWADWWLIKLDDAIDLTQHRVEDATSHIDRYLRAQMALEIGIARSECPCRIKLRFVSPYAYRGAQLVAEFDAAVRTILTARHVGLLTVGQAERRIHDCSGVLRALFALPQGYRLCRLTRAAVMADVPAAGAAAAAMGALPRAVLLGEHRPRLGPRRAKP